MTYSCRFWYPELPNYSISKITLLILEFHCPKSKSKMLTQKYEWGLWVLEAFPLLYKPAWHVFPSLQVIFFPAIPVAEVTPFLCRHPHSRQQFRCKSISNSSDKSICTKPSAPWSTGKCSTAKQPRGTWEPCVPFSAFIPPFFCNSIPWVVWIASKEVPETLAAF